jgi:hypothetical protein
MQITTGPALEANTRAPRAPNRVAVAAAAGLLGLLLAGAGAGGAQPPAAPYPKMAPLAEYLMPRDAEVALARTAAPTAISADATVLVLTRKGFETAVKGSDGFTCMVDRSWAMSFDNAEFWNPKVRTPTCYNPAAARSVVPSRLYRAKLALQGLSRSAMLDKIRAAVARGEIPHPEPGAMSYMMSKEGYITDGVGHWYAHLMFHVEKSEASSWGANEPGSPVIADTSAKEVPEDETIFFVPVRRWSDGTLVAYGTPAAGTSDSHGSH